MREDETGVVLSIDARGPNVILQITENGEVLGEFEFSPAKADVFAAALINNAQIARRSLPKL